jgi:hypothetical protein
MRRRCGAAPIHYSFPRGSVISDLKLDLFTAILILGSYVSITIERRATTKRDSLRHACIFLRLLFTCLRTDPPDKGRCRDP